MSTKPQIPLAKVRAFWWQRQRLEDRALVVPADVTRVGWLYSGGFASHLAAFARMQRVDRAAVDGAAVAGDLVDVPTVRGCSMVVPREDAALALWMGRRVLARRLDTLERKLGFSRDDLEPVIEAAWEALADGPQSPQELRGRLPGDLARSFGDAGKKIGESSTVPLALRSLEVTGRVERIPADGRLDGGRYLYRRAENNPFDRAALPEDDAEVLAELALRFLAWASPATVDELAWWAGIGKREARAAIEALGLVALEVPGWTDEAWALPSEVDMLGFVDPAAMRAARLLPLRDNYIYLRRQPAVFAPEAATRLRVLTLALKPAPLTEVETVFNQTVVVGGRLVGVWDWDLEGDRLVARILSDVTDEERAAVDAAAEETAAYLRSELDGAPLWLLDSPRARARRLEAMEAL